MRRRQFQQPTVGASGIAADLTYLLVKWVCIEEYPTSIVVFSLASFFKKKQMHYNFIFNFQELDPFYKYWHAS